MTTWFVSRHPGAIAWAAEQGLAIDRTIAHLEPGMIKPGDTVIGSLPVHLAATVCSANATYVNLSLELPADWRGRELSAQELRQCKATLQAFTITPPTTPPNSKA